MTVLKWLGRMALAALLAAVVVGVWKREELVRLWAVQTLFNEDRIVANFSNMDAAFLTRDVARGDGPVSPLPMGPQLTMPEGFGGWLEERAITSVVVLKDGARVFEDYYKGTGPDDRRISWSIAKSYLSALFGTVVAEGLIDLDAPVTQYAPALAGGAYDGATVLDVLQMESGITFNEDYLDQSSDINRMGRIIALGGEMDGFAAGLTETFAAPGEQWKYTSIDTHVVGMVIRGATGQDIASLMSERIMTPLGLEQTPYYLTDGVGTAFVLGGLNLTSRDYARFGQMILQDGAWDGQQIVPADWIEASILPSAKTQEGKIGYGYQWWIPVGAEPGDEVLGRGIYGQYLYLDRSSGVVIVVTAADRQFRDAGAHAQNIEMLRQITARVEAMSGT
ncbi:MAG: serine hydrolase [Pseudomonadota bacterium]